MQIPSSKLMNPALLGVPLYSQTIDLRLPIPLHTSNLQSLVLVP